MAFRVMQDDVFNELTAALDVELVHSERLGLKLFRFEKDGVTFYAVQNPADSRIGVYGHQMR